MAKVEWAVRRVSRGFWTYDLIYCDEGYRHEYSVGECHSRRDAEKRARAAANAEAKARSMPSERDFAAALGPCGR